MSVLASEMFKFTVWTSRQNVSQDRADAVSETSSSSSSLEDITDDEMFEEYMIAMKKRINSHRRRLRKFRGKPSSSSSKDFKLKTPSPSDEEHPQRIKDLEGLTSSCVQETLDVVVSCNKNSDEQCHVELEEDEDLVDFHYDLSLEISSRLYTEERVSKWKKTKLFFKNVMKPFRKVLKRAQSSILA